MFPSSILLPIMSSTKKIPQEEYLFVCPHCMSQISVVIPLNVKEKMILERCDECDNQIEITYYVEEGEIVEFYAEKA